MNFEIGPFSEKGDRKLVDPNLIWKTEVFLDGPIGTEELIDEYLSNLYNKVTSAIDLEAISIAQSKQETSRFDRLERHAEELANLFPERHTLIHEEKPDKSAAFFYLSHRDISNLISTNYVPRLGLSETSDLYRQTLNYFENKVGIDLFSLPYALFVITGTTESEVANPQMSIPPLAGFSTINNLVTASLVWRCFQKGSSTLRVNGYEVEQILKGDQGPIGNFLSDSEIGAGYVRLRNPSLDSLVIGANNEIRNSFKSRGFIPVAAPPDGQFGEKHVMRLPLLELKQDSPGPESVGNNTIKAARGKKQKKMP